ncbi:MAG: hypothetical protein PHV95_09025 [Eubacteriales bacterium]|nr:hypothetical protein [Eubacteriales bacterium]MDD4475910.1 hypothetical protein [Eubacteriales bacterium]
MKKAGIIFSLSILMCLMSFSVCFASGLQLLHSYPENDSSDSMLENVVVKLYFNEDVSAKEVQQDNKGAFKFTNEKGKELPLRILYPKNSDEIWVLVNKPLESNSEYKLVISGDLKMANGDTLGQDQIVKFKTRNTGTDTTVNMALMGLMVVGMIAYTSIATKRAMKKEEKKKADEIKVNPYKVAKKTGKSVEAVVAQTEKDKEKARERKNGRGAVNEDDASAQETEMKKDTKKVAGARPISVTGSTYITGRKAKAEREKELAAAKAVAGTTRPKGTTGKSKNQKTNKKR